MPDWPGHLYVAYVPTQGLKRTWNDTGNLKSVCGSNSGQITSLQRSSEKLQRLKERNIQVYDD